MLKKENSEANCQFWNQLENKYAWGNQELIECSLFARVEEFIRLQSSVQGLARVFQQVVNQFPANGGF